MCERNAREEEEDEEEEEEEGEEGGEEEEEGEEAPSEISGGIQWAGRARPVYASLTISYGAARDS